MKKRILPFLIIWVICISSLAIHVSANPNYGYYPVNYSTYISTASYNTPKIDIQIMNNTEKNITKVDFICSPKTSSGKGIKYYGYGSHQIALTVTGQLSDMYTLGTVSFDLSGYPGASDKTTIKLEAVTFSDGTTWYNKRNNYYTEANFEILNQQSADGSYVIDNSHKIKLLDNGFSVYHRDWYIWNDGVGWVWFSNEINPTCTVWGQGASIKLVINCNQNLYKKIDFSVKKSLPVFQIKSQDSQELKYSYTQNNKFVISKYASVPHRINLWDISDTATKRDWYVWNDGVGWVWFSDQRGPVCELWKAGSHAIKLVHDGDPNYSTTYYFSIAIASGSYL